MVTDAQVRKLMEEMSKHGKVGLSALRAGMDRKTGAKYVSLNKLPSELKKPREYRTREDPFESDWEFVREMLVAAPELEAKALFEHLMEERPGEYEEGQLRTFQRKVKRWRAQEGPTKEVYFAQNHCPGEAMQTDFMHLDELNITIEGVVFAHMVCHCVLPYSNWQWATVVFSESMAAIKLGLQRAIFALGHLPEWHQTDNSTSATHRIPNAEKAQTERPGKRPFNKDYQDLMDHYGLKPRTIAVGESQQNGDVESLNGATKRKLRQHLILRGSRDFESREAYQSWLDGVLSKSNTWRSSKVDEEKRVMKVLHQKRLPEYVEETLKVSSWSTIRIRHNAYSVPSRLIGEYVRARVFEDHIDIYYAQKLEMSVPRLLGRMGHHIDYRHIIWSLVRKPGAFARYRYRDSLFPRLAFRRAYDALLEALPQFEADLEYLRILHQAASTMETEVASALEGILASQELPLSERVKSITSPREVVVPSMDAPRVNLFDYDALLKLREELCS